MKKVEKHCLVLIKYYLELPALARYCIESIQINLNNYYSNDNKPALKVELTLTLSRLVFLNTNERRKGDPVKPNIFFTNQK